MSSSGATRGAQPVTRAPAPPPPPAPPTASAWRSAFSDATTRGAPSSSSATSETRTSKSTPRSPRIARPCGEPLAGARGCNGVPQLQLGEPDPDRALGRLVGVRAVHEVLADLDREVAADRAGGGL